MLQAISGFVSKAIGWGYTDEELDSVFTSADGVHYRPSQYAEAMSLVREYYNHTAPGRSLQMWDSTTVGAIMGYLGEKPFEYYMRDLVRGFVISGDGRVLFQKEE